MGRTLVIAAGCLLSLLSEGCVRNINLTTTVCEEPGTVTLLYASEGASFRILNSDGEEIPITESRIVAESLFTSEDVFTSRMLNQSPSSMALNESLLLEWTEEGTDYQLTLNELEPCSSCMEINGGTLVDDEISEAAEGLSLQVIYSNAQSNSRTLLGTLAVGSVSTTVDLDSYSCQLDCESKEPCPGDCGTSCNCDYSCDNGLSGSYGTDENSCGDEDEEASDLKFILNSTCTINSLPVTSPYATFDIELE